MSAGQYRLITIIATFVLTLVVLEVHNVIYYALVIFNSPHLTLIWVDIAVLVTFFVLLEECRHYVKNYLLGLLAIFFIPSYVNTLVLGIYILAHHFWCCIGSLFGKVSSGLTDYFFVSAVLPAAFYVSSLAVSAIVAGMVGLLACVTFLSPLISNGKHENRNSHLILFLLMLMGCAWLLAAVLLPISSFSGSILITYLAYDKVSSYDASTLVYLEGVLERYYIAIPVLAVPVIVFLICVIYKQYKLFTCLFVIVVVNTVISAAVIGCVSATHPSKQAVPSVPLPEQDAVPSVPRPEQDGYCAAGGMACMAQTSAEPTQHRGGPVFEPDDKTFDCGEGECIIKGEEQDEKVLVGVQLNYEKTKITTTSIISSVTPLSSVSAPLPVVSPVPSPTSSLPEATRRCLEIDRNDQQAIKLHHLVYLEYLDGEGERRELNIMDEIAGSWKRLGRHLDCDVNQIAGNHVMGMDYSLNCCHEVLTRWFNKGGTRQYPLSWKGLVKALRAVELGRMATSIEIALKCVIDD